MTYNHKEDYNLFLLTGNLGTLLEKLFEGLRRESKKISENEILSFLSKCSTNSKRAFLYNLELNKRASMGLLVAIIEITVYFQAD